MKYQHVRQLQAGDQVYVFISPRFVRLLDRLFAGPTDLRPDDRDFFGIFDVDPNQPISALAAAYGVAALEAAADVSIADFIAARVGGRAEIGDRVPLGRLELVVREVDEESRATAVGLALHEEAAPASGPARFWSRLKAFLARLRS